ncbi:MULTISPECIES: hypothetical protein [Burkholderia]|uniref:Uncharacterized protein n=1 Tax=Burkholderia lata (strain ATCC 17760 / DSM 23089 / LMG 22485 / NCIMB 9086 / R18194 / 383) TaxID=482957 RepID=A0A6P2N0D5_BURL3|nr:MULTISPECIES: hypothetical protein [Burkholderia]MBN3772600.1 hypothetical protein [Burkholderia sp. Se-20378]MBN3794043.1 hypothetical protein [Burkholderia sp. Ac-20392]VWB84664.1 hypothetical protein BLA6863_04023 [Burkholderia lata]VWC10625.1 hypothetical protein BLA6860_05285 [Burkholderia lata]VWM12897.1 hypothetical protein BLA6992_04723 [Burkholderia lata]
MKPLLRAGEHIEGMHWIAEYRPLTHEIRVLREDIEIGIYSAPPTMFGEEEDMGAANLADHRSREAALRAYLRNFVKDHDAEE